MAREDGFTLLEMLVVMIVLTILSAVALGFSAGARESAADAAAKTNIDVAVPAMNAYALDNGGFAGMTLARLQADYSPGIRNVTILSARDSAYCATSAVDGRTWYKQGPSGPVTTAPCS